MKMVINFFKKKKWMGLLIFALLFFGVIYFVLHYSDIKEGAATATTSPTVKTGTATTSPTVKTGTATTSPTVKTGTTTATSTASVKLSTPEDAKKKIISHIENSKDPKDQKKFCASGIASKISADKDLITYFSTNDKTNHPKFSGKAQPVGNNTANNVISVYAKYFTGSDINKYAQTLNKTC